jgi:hypothetical protein
MHAFARKIWQHSRQKCFFRLNSKELRRDRNVVRLPYTRWLYFGISIGLLSYTWSPPVLAADIQPYRDIYLTEDRICKGCQWKLLPKQEVQLTNRLGESIVVRSKEIIGINNHPWNRKLLLKSLNGVGLPGKVIVPFAFEDGEDFVCKYCD